jgi:hypothetical protein
LDVDIKGEDLSIANAHKIIPDTFRKAVNKYKGRGTLDLATKIKGKMGEQNTPKVTAEFQTEASSVTMRGEQLMSDLRTEGVFSNGKKRSFASTYFEFSRADFKHHDNELRLRDVKVMDMTEPLLRGKIGGVWEIQPTDSVYLPAGVAPQSGQLHFKDLLVMLWFKEEQNNKLGVQDLQLQGGIDHEDISFVYQDSLLVEAFEGQSKMQQKTLLFKDWQGRINQNPFTLTGEMTNFQPWLQQLILGKKTKAKTFIEANLESDSCRLDRLFWQSPDGANNNTQKDPPLSYLSNTKIYFDAQVDKLYRGRFSAKNFTGAFQWKNQALHINNMTFNTMSGKMKMTGYLSTNSDTPRYLSGNLLMRGVDIRQLFYQMRNFAQKTLTHDHLRGRLSSDIQARLPVRNDFSLVYDSIFAEADVPIQNGELINFEPAEASSSYVNVKALKHMKFSKLQNQVRIRDRVIYIPTMDIYSNAMNLTLAGKHTFDNNIDYKLKVKLSQLMSKKVNKNPDNIEKNKRGGLNLYLTMKGPVQDPVIQYNRRSVKEKIQQDLQQEKEEVKQVMKDEFSGNSAKDTIQEWEDEETESPFINWDTTEQQQ